MDLVVDANVLFSALIKEGFTTELMFSDQIRLFAPEFLLEEFFKHENEILEKTKRNKDDFSDILEILKLIIKITPAEEFDIYTTEAEAISPDPDDVQYFALALKLQCGIWSNDKMLKEQNSVSVYSTEEIAKKFT